MTSNLKDIIIKEIASCASHKKVYEFKISYATFKECRIYVEEKTVLLTKDLFQEINSDMEYEICSAEWKSLITKFNHHVPIEHLGVCDDNSSYTDIDTFQTTNGSDYCQDDLKNYARIHSVELIN